MQDQTAGKVPATAGDAEAPGGSRETELREALRQVHDPENGIDVVRLGLIRDVTFEHGGVTITMVLTTPFCPYGDYLVQQVVDAARSVVSGEVRVAMGEEVWHPSMMEGEDLSEWGLV